MNNKDDNMTIIITIIMIMITAIMISIMIINCKTVIYVLDVFYIQ